MKTSEIDAIRSMSGTIPVIYDSAKTLTRTWVEYLTLPVGAPYGVAILEADPLNPHLEHLWTFPRFYQADLVYRSAVRRKDVPTRDEILDITSKTHSRTYGARPSWEPFLDLHTRITEILWEVGHVKLGQNQEAVNALAGVFGDPHMNLNAVNSYERKSCLKRVIQAVNQNTEQPIKEWTLRKLWSLMDAVTKRPEEPPTVMLDPIREPELHPDYNPGYTVFPYHTTEVDELGPMTLHPDVRI